MKQHTDVGDAYSAYVATTLVRQPASVRVRVVRAFNVVVVLPHMLGTLWVGGWTIRGLLYEQPFAEPLAVLCGFVSLIAAHLAVVVGLTRARRWSIWLCLALTLMECVAAVVIHGENSAPGELGLKNPAIGHLALWPWAIFPPWVTVPLFLGVNALTLPLLRRFR